MRTASVSLSLSRLLSGAALLSVLSLFACASSAPADGGADSPAPAERAPQAEAPADAAATVSETTDLEPYTESIPGTTLEFEMIPVPAGSVTMQTEEGPREVSVGPFWISKTEIPWELYDPFVFGFDNGGREDPALDAVSRPSKPYVLPGEDFGHQGYPALGSTFNAASAFTEWLSIHTESDYRLPTGAEWVYVCEASQAGSTPDEQVWYAENAEQQTQPVGSSAPNEWGIHDLLGNVAEWTAAGPASEEPLVRGGSYRDAEDDVTCRAVQEYDRSWQARDPQLPKSEWWLSDAPFVGIRVIRVPDA